MPPSPPTLVARNLEKHFGARTLFSGVNLSVEEGERLALIGPNGSGKSTLLKMLAGLSDVDAGSVTMRKGLRAAYVAQADVFGPDDTILSAVLDAVHAARLPHLHDEHEVETHVQQVLGRMDLPEEHTRAAVLSGGQRKRLSVARAIAIEPDLLLLDEPTNHLDVEGILWLESILQRGGYASIVVTHDRQFLETIATRIVELSPIYPEQTLSVAGNYTEFLRRKQEVLDGQTRAEQALANQVREDIRWLTRGVQARRTKAKSRAADAHGRIDQLAELRARNTSVKSMGIEFAATDRRTQKLLVARAVGKTLGDRPLFRDLDVILSPGHKLGLLGPNGAGKSTLIKVLTGEMASDPPSAAAMKAAEVDDHDWPPGSPLPGEVRRATALRVVVFSQHRTELDPQMTLSEALSPVDSVIYRGRAMHIVTWASKFLFRREQLVSPVGTLSGGEQARVHIARLMLEPADILVLDEPTNDLDIPTLEVLEESLEEFPGALLLVTHDRAMLSRLATHVLALDGTGGASYYADYEQWQSVQERKSKASKASAAAENRANAAAAASSARDGASASNATNAATAPTKRKLTYSEQRELAQIEPGIEATEAEVVRLEAIMHDPAVMADHKRLDTVCRELGEAQAKVARLYERWAELT